VRLKKIFLICIIFAATILAVTDSKLVTASLFFQRSFTEKGATDTIDGQLLYKKDGVIRIIVNKPVVQRMSLDGKTMTIFYPLEKKAFRIIGRTIFDLPFFQAFLTALQPRFFLEKQEFQKESMSKIADTTKERWLPPLKIRKAVGAIELNYVNATLARLIAYTPENDKLIITSMSEYTETNLQSFPSIIHTSRLKAGKESVEILRINKAIFNESIKKFDTEFKIPLDVKIVEIRL
jgi:hypothetical protein